MRQFIGYHGNERHLVQRSCNESKYHVSLSNDHWLGNGTYFFEDTPEGNGLRHAKAWSMYRQHQNPAILKTNISVEPQYLFDLEDTKFRDLFNELKERAIDGMLKMDKKPKEGYVDGLFFNFWDKFFSRYGPIFVIRRMDYYQTEKDIARGTRSRTPNVYVLCVRNTECLSNPESISS